MNIKKILLNIIAIISIVSIYIIPVRSIGLDIEILSNYNIFEELRLIFMILCILFIIFNKKYTLNTYIYTTFILLIFVLKIVCYKEYDFGYIYILGAIIYIDIMLNNKFNVNVCNKIFNIAFYGYIIQIFIFSIVEYIKFGKFEITASFNDANYTAYFSFCLGMYFHYIGNKLKRNILLIIGLFTYSRLFIINIVIFYLLNLIVKIGKKNKKILNIYDIRFYILVQIILLIIGYIYIHIYERLAPEYVYLEGFSRLGNMLDESNYIRVMANKLALESINLTNSIIGLKAGTFKGINMFTNKVIFPHNLFWSLFIQYGLIVTIVFIKKYCMIFKRYGYGLMPYYICILIYHSILGLSSFYGVDIIIQFMIVSTIYNIKVGVNYAKK